MSNILHLFSNIKSDYGLLLSTTGKLLHTAIEASGVTGNSTFLRGDGTWTSVAGKQTAWIPAGAIVPRTTTGCGTSTLETATNKVCIKTCDFDTATQEHAQFSIRMPKSWDEGTLSAYFCWTAVTGSGDVVWGIQSSARSDDDPIDIAFGTAVEVGDSLTTTGDFLQTSETSAMTVTGTPSELDLVNFQIYRNVTSAGDTLTGDANLIGIALMINNNATNDN